MAGWPVPFDSRRGHEKKVQNSQHRFKNELAVFIYKICQSCFSREWEVL
jgi:hypothetical protein